jgi:hypothetical protein
LTNYGRTDRPDRLLVAGAIVAAATYLVMQEAFFSTGKPLFADTDDAMRMVTVRDLLAGQSWYDHVQHRLNTPFGAEIHWSHLVDLPIAALIALFSPFVGSSGAQIAASYFWPMLLLGLLLWVSARLTFRLVGPEGVLPALVLPVLSPAIIAEFTPGRIDHHNLVIVLTLAIAWTGIEGLRQRRYALYCGLLCATALAIAVESLPAVIAAIGVFGMLWVLGPEQGASTRRFGYAFGFGAAAQLALYRAPNRWLEAACDVLSPVYVLAALAVGFGFAVATLMQAPRSRWARVLILASLGLAGIVPVLALYPQCLAGPYGALDPWLQQNWLSSIAEAKPWIASAYDLPPYTLAVGVPVLLAIIVVLLRVWRASEDRGAWAALLVFLLCSAIVMLAQIRGARLAVMPAIPAAAWLIVLARNYYLQRPRLVPALGMLASWIVFCGMVIALSVSSIVNLFPGRAQTVAQVRADKELCLLPSAFAVLAKQSPQRIMAPIDLGSHLLLHTPHAVVAAPYHRNQAGVLAAFRFFNGPMAEAQAILAERKIDLVVTCPAMPEMRGLPSKAPDSFVALAEAGNLPPWLVEIDGQGPLRIYAVQSDF